MENEEINKRVYALLENHYLKINKEKGNEFILFPLTWKYIDDLEERIEVLADAIKNEVLIIDAKSFQKHMETVIYEEDSEQRNS